MAFMQTIGERLEEARKRRGVTIQEAAKETKIREEYLVGLEKNDGHDIPLEAIYVRGFVRSYAHFLRVDPGKLLADFDANSAGAVSNAATPKAQKELIGRLELGSEAQPAPVLPDKQESPMENAESAAAPKKVSDNFKNFHFPAWALPVAIGFVAVLLIAGAVAGTGAYFKAKDAKHKIAAVASEIKIVALGDVTVIVKQIDGDLTLFAGTLKKGQEKTLTRLGSVKIQYSDGNLVQVVRDGRPYKMGSAGAGKRIVE
jgi:cytoskeletal protein RodZ